MSTSDWGYEAAVTVSRGEKGMRTLRNDTVSDDDGGEVRVVGDLTGSVMQICNGEDLTGRREDTVGGDKIK